MSSAVCGSPPRAMTDRITRDRASGQMASRRRDVIAGLAPRGSFDPARSPPWRFVMSRIPLFLGIAVAAVALAVRSGTTLALPDTNLMCLEVPAVKDPTNPGQPFFLCDPF